ncbi:MAG: hypothetical protein ACLFPL_02860 [Candidatus Nanoarchaeia archaeon]
MLQRIQAQFSNQAFFAILMLVAFMGILIFGYNSITGIQQELDEEELNDLRQSILSQTGICAQSSQRGRLESLNIAPNSITHVCYISNTSEFSPQFTQIAQDRGLTQNHTVLLLNGPRDVDFTSISGISELDEFIVYDIIPLRDNVELASPQNGCQIREESDFNFQFQC